MSTSTTTPTTTGAQPAPEDLSWLGNLNDPTKLTPAQRAQCGIDPPFTCNAGDHKKKKRCREFLAGTQADLRKKCEQKAAIPPPPVFSEPPPRTNVYASTGVDEASQSAQSAELAEAIHQLRSSQGAAGAIPTDPYAPPGDEFAPYGGVARNRSPYGQAGALEEPAGLLDSIPTWAFLAGGLALAWLAFK